MVCLQNEQQRQQQLLQVQHLLTISAAGPAQVQRRLCGQSTLNRTAVSGGTHSACCITLCSHAVLQAKPYQRADYSHSTTKLMKIAYDNQLLVKRLTSISHKVRHAALRSHPAAQRSVALPCFVMRFQNVQP
jgi:hypothetical protein